MLGASCSNHSVLLNFSGCSSFVVSAPLLPVWVSLIPFSSCWFSSSPDATACQSAICSSFQGSIGTSAAPFSSRPNATVCRSAIRFSGPLFSLSFALSSAILSLYAIHPSSSCQCSFNNGSDCFSAFVIMWLDRSSMRCQRSTTRTTSSLTMIFNVSRQHVESSRFSLWNYFPQ